MVLIPSLLEVSPVLLDDPLDFRDLSTAKPPRSSQGYRIQPELGISLGLLDVDVRRFLTLPAEEKEAVAFDSENLRHRLILPAV
jgi:hypothetical protein